jgi:cytochrome P450
MSAFICLIPNLSSMPSRSRRPPSPPGLPVIGHGLDFVRSPFEFVNDVTNNYGDVSRVELPGMTVYLLSHPEYFRQVLVTDIGGFAKTEDYRRAFGNGLLSAEGSQWSRQREILQPLFHRNRIGGYSDYMVKATQRRLSTWKPGETRDVESEMQDLTIEILFATLFGRELPPGEGEELRDASDNLNKWFTPTSWFLPRWIPTPARREFSDSAGRLRTEVRRLLAEYETESSRRPDVVTFDGNSSQDTDRPQNETLLSKLQDARDATEKESLSTEEIEDQLLTMIFAGYETTAAALAFAWYSLATNPGIREAFHNELNTVLNGEPPTAADISDLDLTNRIVTETLRLYPPIHTIPRQTTRDVEIDGYRLPADEQVHLSVISVHRDERFYDQPLSFRPNRWTPDFEEELAEYAFIPFGGGRRTCIGREFARLEAVLALATIGQQFRLDWAGKDTDINITPEITTTTKNGLPMVLRKR